jgi:fibro-slime domain-containing protein
MDSAISKAAGALVVMALTACSSNPDPTVYAGGAGGAGAGGSDGSAGFDPDNPVATDAGGLDLGDGGGLGGFGGSTAPPIDLMDFVETEVGGYKLGPELTGDDSLDDLGGQSNGSACSVIVGVVRDFRPANATDGHPDFDTYEGRGATTGLVEEDLGADGKPVYASVCEAMPDDAACPFGQQTTSRDDFDVWYRSTEGTNRSFALFLNFAQENGVSTFESNAFFPVDDAGYGDSDDEHGHNFGFTIEVHTKFRYGGGEHFTFTGDDDLWVFVNGKLAIDLGGLHPAATADLDLDEHAGALGITTGNVYELSLFHAERHFTESNFRVDTTLAFTECGLVGPQ